MAIRNPPICAVILAAGQSKRMGCCKQLLPWGKETIISHIISVFQQMDIDEIIVVTGGYRRMVEAAVAKSGAKMVFNPDYENDEMTLSMQIGLKTIEEGNFSGCFIALGDNPNIHTSDLQKMVERHTDKGERIIIPSFEMHRGHPWFIPQKYFSELMKLNPPKTMRDFLMNHEHDIEYVQADSPDILSDIDTPEDYERLKPSS